MEQEPKQIGSLLEILSATNFEAEPEPYILTPEDEAKIIDNILFDLKRHKMWKLKGLAYTDEQIKTKISEIDWEKEINRDEILKRHNSHKNYELWEKKQREKEKEDAIKKLQELKSAWTAENVFKLMRWTSENTLGRPLIINDSNRHLITAICFFVSEDPRFETELGYSLSKGLLIRGISGLGKTHLVRCVEKNELNPILVLSMIEIADEIKMEGEYQIKLGSNRMIYLDDVGTEEPTVNHYGTKINFFKNFIEMVYLRNQNKTFNKLIMSTNNSFSEIEDKYGFRVRSRMRDMFNVIDVKGEDMRG